MSEAMAPSLALIVAGAVLAGAGVYLMLARSIVRMLLGFILVGNGVNLLFLAASGPPGKPPLIEEVPSAAMADPLPQAFVLTAIVIPLLARAEAEDADQGASFINKIFTLTVTVLGAATVIAVIAAVACRARAACSGTR